MSSLPPPSRLRQKTSDFTDFIRGTGHSAASYSTDPSLSTATVNMLEVPQSGEESTSPKKKITRIPLFGRSRKKSNQSASSSPFVSSCIGRESMSEGGEQSSVSRGPSVERRPSETTTTTPVPPLPVPNKASSSSLSSKFAARFSHSRSKAVVSNVDQPPPVPAVQSSSLHPPSATRGASFDSTSSVMTKSRSTTPRPLQPAITVSLSPDDDERFRDLFTKATPVSSPSVPPKAVRTTQSRNVPDADTSAQTPAPAVPSKESSVYRRGQTPASAIAASIRHRHTASNERPPSTTSKASRKNSDSSEKEQDSGTSTPRLSDAQHESPRPSDASPALEEKGIPASLTRRPTSTGADSLSPSLSSGRAPSIRSRSKQSAISSRPSKPPTMPLPLPPSPSLPSSSPPNSPTFPRLPQHAHKDSISSMSTSSQVTGLPRTRMPTLSTGGNSARSSRISPSPASPTSPTSPAFTIKPANPAGSPRNSNEAFDIDNASAEQLRTRLRARDKQYDELALYVEKLQKAHKREVEELQSRISTLEKDSVKLEKQIQGFMWMINENTPQQPKAPAPGPAAQTRSTAVPVHESEPETGRGSLSSRIRSRLVYNSDSGAESPAESLLVSGASGSESVTSAIMRRRIRRPYPIGDGSYAASRSGSILRPTNVPPSSLVEKGLPDIPSNLAANSNANRASVSSISVSASSSTSSLLPPSPSITMSSLSAIPEGPPSALRPPQSYGADHLDSDRRNRLMANRISTSSMASSATAASSSYSANIKRSRPPSIAQVLETSPKDYTR